MALNGAGFPLTSNTRMRWSGKAARGTMTMGCINRYGALVGPLNVVGVEEGALCEPGQAMTVLCSLNLQNSAPEQALAFIGFTLKTTMANGTSAVRSLPFTSNRAVYYVETNPPGVFYEFNCRFDTRLPPGRSRTRPSCNGASRANSQRSSHWSRQVLSTLESDETGIGDIKSCSAF
jgi:hypothetical protein